MMLRNLGAAHDYQHVFLAPHPDDAALSCGGTIARLRDEGARVLVVTVCAGTPAPGALSPFARYLHAAWALGDDPMAARRAEDADALAVLGCDGLQLDELDAPYRLTAYGEGDAWRGPVAPDDPLLPAMRRILRLIVAQQPAARLYLPLGAGNHVDHQVVFMAAADLQLRGDGCWFYEDLPYAAKQPQAVAGRLAALGERWQPRVVDITATTQRKLAAVAAHASQQRELFGDADGARMLLDYAASVAVSGGYAERFWIAPPSE